LGEKGFSGHAGLIKGLPSLAKLMIWRLSKVTLIQKVSKIEVYTTLVQKLKVYAVM